MVPGRDCGVGLGDGLAFLAADALTHNTHALALVRLRRVEGADIGGDGSHELLVGAFDLQLGLIGDGDLDALRDVKEDRVRVTEREVDLFALQVGLEADPLNFEILDVAPQTRP